MSAGLHCLSSTLIRNKCFLQLHEIFIHHIHNKRSLYLHSDLPLPLKTVEEQPLLLTSLTPITAADLIMALAHKLHEKIYSVFFFFFSAKSFKMFTSHSVHCPEISWLEITTENLLTRTWVVLVFKHRNLHSAIFMSGATSWLLWFSSHQFATTRHQWMCASSHFSLNMCLILLFTLMQNNAREQTVKNIYHFVAPPDHKHPHARTHTHAHSYTHTVWDGSLGDSEGIRCVPAVNADWLISCLCLN